MLAGQRHDGVHVGGLAVEMDRHDRTRARRDGRRDTAGSMLRPAGVGSTGTTVAPTAVTASQVAI